VSRTIIVGVLNVTPDSFSDGGRYAEVDQAVAHGLRMAEEGADWIDVGGESTRPGAAPVDAAGEVARVLPVIERLAARLPGRVRLSIDTMKAAVARAAVEAGATVVNDVSGGLADPTLLGLARPGLALVLGHMRGTPATMMEDIGFGDVVAEVGEELVARVQSARRAGWSEVWADPGLGFGKRGEHNLALLRRLPEVVAQVGVPVMVGPSRKRFIGDLTGRGPAQRDWGTAAAVTAAILGGAKAIRVHDVAAMCDVARVADAVAGA